MLVSVVIPLLGNPSELFFDLIADLRSELLEVGESEIIVVQSGSKAPLDMDGVRVFWTSRRLLPAEARNRGGYAAVGRALFFIDGDNRLRSGALKSVLGRLDQGLECVVACATHFMEDADRVAFYGASHQVHAWRTFFYSEQSAIGPEIEVEVAANAYGLLRDSFLYVGGFDGRLFPSHFEESDFCYRLRAASGKKIVCLPEAVVYNDMPVDARARLVPKDALRSFNNARSRPIFIAKHLGRYRLYQYLLLWQFVLLGVHIGAEALSAVRVVRAKGSPHWSVGAYIWGMCVGGVSALSELRIRN